MSDTDRSPDSPAGEHPADIESNEPIPRDLYDDTYVGASLADLIDQMHSRHQELMTESTGAPAHGDPLSEIDLENFEDEVERTLPRAPEDSPVLSLADEETGAPPSSPSLEAVPPSAATAPSSAHREADDDDLAVLMREFERRVRRYVQGAARGERERLHAQLAERIAKVKHAAVQEVRRQAKAYREKYRSDHTGREQSLRTQYDKLMALAHRISRQKAELQRARKELEGKLQATVRLQKEIDGLREALTQSIGNFDLLEEEDVAEQFPPAAPEERVS